MNTNKHKKIGTLHAVISAILLFTMLSFPALANECPFENKEGYLVYYDAELATELSNDINKYIVLLNDVNFESFEEKNMSGDFAVSLREEVDETISSMKTLDKKAQLIKAKSQCQETPNTVKEWVEIARLLSKVSRYISDIEDAGILKEKDCFSCLFINVRLSQIFDFIEARLDNTAVIR